MLQMPVHAAPSLAGPLPAHRCMAPGEMGLWDCGRLPPAIFRPINQIDHKASDSYEIAQPSWSRQNFKWNPPASCSLSRMHEAQPATSTQHRAITANHCKKVCFASIPVILVPAPWPGGSERTPHWSPRSTTPYIHGKHTPKQFILGLSSPLGLLTCPCLALTTVLDWSTWLQQPQLFMVIAELIIK